MKKVMGTIILISAVFACFAMYASATTRTALVIGNGAYKLSALRNPINDASDMAAALKDRGFNVAFKINATQKTMERAIRKFGQRLREGGVGLFYYAGHGIQVKGNNYLIPIGSVIESEADVKYEAVDAGLVLGKMEDAGNDLNIVILDACRNNPFARSFRSSSMGLARMDAPKGTLIAYATAPGSLAADGGGRNGIYTKHLIKNIQKSQYTVEQVFKNVRVAVVSETSNKQVPWESSSLMGTFYFDLQQTEQNNIKQAVIKKQPVDNSYELLFWESIKDSKDANMFEAYMEKFPNGIFSGLAEINVQKYRTKHESNHKPVKMKNGTLDQSIMTTSISPGEKGPAIIARDGQYVKYKNGIVYDKKSNLEWVAGPDKYTDGDDAQKWVKHLNLDGGGWRMATIRELKGLHKSGVGMRNMTPLLDTSAWWVWSSKTGGFSFYYGNNFSLIGLLTTDWRAFAVRFRSR